MLRWVRLWKKESKFWFFDCVENIVMVKNYEEVVEIGNGVYGIVYKVCDF